MRRLSLLLAATITLAPSSLLLAQDTDANSSSRPHMCRHGHGGGMFDAGTVSTIRGVVDEVSRVNCEGCGHTGVHLSLTVDSKPLSIHLGPAWFLDESGVELAKGDELSVTGSRVEMDGEDVVIAATVERGDSVLKLRDSDGFPVWGGWRKASGRS